MSGNVLSPDYDKWRTCCEQGRFLCCGYSTAAEEDSSGAEQVDQLFAESNAGDICAALTGSAEEFFRTMLRLRDTLIVDRNEWAREWSEAHQDKLADMAQPDEDAGSDR